MANTSRNSYLGKNGQGVVEYILLLAVVSALTFSVVDSDRFKDFIGEDSPFFALIVERIEYSYRHGRAGKSSSDSTNNSYGGTHESYFNSDENRSRFFSAADKYPN